MYEDTINLLFNERQFRKQNKTLKQVDQFKGYYITSRMDMLTRPTAWSYVTELATV